MEIEFANQNFIGYDLLKSENLKVDAIAKYKILEKVKKFDKEIQEALISNHDDFYAV